MKKILENLNWLKFLNFQEIIEMNNLNLNFLLMIETINYLF
jgi:hypothetical protein